MCNKNNDYFTLYSKSLLTTLNISAVIIILDRTHLTCVSSYWCWHLRRIKPIWDLKQIHVVKRRKEEKSATCALVREIQQNRDISGSRAHLNTVVTHKLRGTAQIHLPKSFADYVFGVADASNPNRWSGVCLGKLQISSTARRQRKKVSSPLTLTDAEFFHRVASECNIMSASGSDDAPRGLPTLVLRAILAPSADCDQQCTANV